MSRQGKTRLAKWYSTSLSTREKNRYIKEVNALVLTRGARYCNFMDYNEYKIVYKRY
jgi:AP-1 complex subunit sigma 1/2